jgi:hypothetical protein
MEVAPAVVDPLGPLGRSRGYMQTLALFRNDEEARQRLGVTYIFWPAYEPIKVPYLEPLK